MPLPPPSRTLHLDPVLDLDLAELGARPEVAWSVAVRDAADGALLAGHTPDRRLRTASVGKLFLLVEVAARLQNGTLDADEPLSWTADEHVADSGLWYLMRQRTLGVADLAVLVGAFSDNLATNVLLRRVGLDAVQARARALGCTRSALLDRVRLSRTPDDPPTLSVGTAADLSAVLAALHRGEVVSAAVARQVLTWLAANADLSMVAAAFDLDPLAHADPDRGVTLVNKTGTITTVRADVGLVAGPAGTLAYAVLAEWTDGVDARDAVLATMRRLGGRLRVAVGG